MARVYFLNPVQHKVLKGKFAINKVQPGLYVIDITLPIPKKIKFHLPLLYNLILRHYLNKINQKTNHKIDIYWNFDQELNIRAFDLFDEAIKIYHPVDDFTPKPHIDYTVFDVCFSVSKAIVNKIPHANKHVINHGLNEVFEKFAFTLLAQKQKTVQTVQTVSYMGNLSIPTLDVETLKKVIINHQDIQFNFIGNYDTETDFIVFLKTQHNVNLPGLKVNEALIEALTTADLFLLCYKYMPGNNMDNSHKVLEYLSTGKVIVSSKLSAYENLGLFPMCTKLDNSEFLDLFDEVVHDFSSYNTPEQMNNRIRFALDNTYEKQVNKINTHLKQIKTLSI